MRDKKDRNAQPGRVDEASAGLPGAPRPAEETLRRAGIDPDRLSIFYLGWPGALVRHAAWTRRFVLALALWLLPLGAEALGHPLPGWLDTGLALVTGLMIIQIACELLVMSTERFAARMRWDHYVAGTVAEILSTLPELVVIAFVIPVSPGAAFVIALITIYNNTLVFSLYSFFLPKNREGRFVMPRPITEAGSQVLTAGAAIGLTLGLMMLVLPGSDTDKQAFRSLDLAIVGGLLLAIFSVYVFRLVTFYAREEEMVRETLDLTEEDIDKRRALVYRNVKPSSLAAIAGLFALGVIGSVLGGEKVSDFTRGALDELGLNPVLTALVLAGFAGMSEYVILWKSHRRREYGIALANAFGGITQVMFLVLPATLIGIAAHQVLGPGAAAPIGFGLSNILLLIFLFPTFFVLLELLEDDHTFDLLDTTIMTSIVLLLILLLTTYGAG